MAQKRRREEETRDWKDGLPSEILHRIANHLDFFPDLVCSFSSVCRSWRSVGLDISYLSCCRSPLLLLLPTNDANSTSSSSYGYECEFFSVCYNQSFKFHFPSELKVDSKVVVGSTHGWLLLQDRDLEVMRFELLDPSTKTRVQLPPYPTMVDSPISNHLRLSNTSKRIVRKALFFNTSDCELERSGLGLIEGGSCFALILPFTALSTGLVAFCSPGDTGWTHACGSHYWADVIYLRGILYGLELNELDFCLYAITCEDDGGRMVVEPNPPLLGSLARNLKESAPEAYLVESSGELLIIIRYFERSLDCLSCYLTTTRFTVFLFDFEEEEWVETFGGIGVDRMVLLGRAQGTISCYIRPGCRANCIYFDDCATKCGEHGGMGIFDVVNGTMEWLSLPREKEEDNYKLKHSFWFLSP